LRGSHCTDRQRNPVDLRLHDAGHCTVPFRTAPDLAFRPCRQLPQLRYLGWLAGTPSGIGFQLQKPPGASLLPQLQTG
jgi:hypothetical protein